MLFVVDGVDGVAGQQLINILNAPAAVVPVQILHLCATLIPVVVSVAPGV